MIHSAGLSSLLHTFKGDTKGEKEGSGHVSEVGSSEYHDEDQTAGLSERETALVNARRVLRQAGWASVFYLITCDILGPFNAPYSIASIGMAPGIILYLLFGVFAFLGGWLLWKVFLGTDSLRYPIKLYGDLAQRIFGTWARHLCSFLQIIQLTLNVGLIVRLDCNILSCWGLTLMLSVARSVSVTAKVSRRSSMARPEATLFASLFALSFGPCAV